MIRNSVAAYSHGIKTVFAALLCLLVIFSCRRDDGEPEPDPGNNGNGGDTTLIASDFNDPSVGVVTQWVSTSDVGGSATLATNFNDGTGVVDYTAKTSDGTELIVGETALAPGKSSPDSSYHLSGTDTNADWWIGTVHLNGNTAFGLPADVSNYAIEFDIYTTNATSNAEIQLQEDDGDVFIYNLGVGGIGLDQNAWKTVIAPLDEFTLASWGNAGDNQFTPASLKNLSFALISGMEAGNSAEIYIDNVNFLETIEELEIAEITLAPGKTSPDSSYHLKGTDANADWWMGTVLGQNLDEPFGLPADTSRISIQFDIYTVNATSNLEIQLQEDDSEAFSYNLGSKGIGLDQNAWKTITAPLGEFEWASWSADNGKVLETASLKNISFALISGMQTGNSAEVYIDNVKFIIEE